MLPFFPKEKYKEKEFIGIISKVSIRKVVKIFILLIKILFFLLIKALPSEGSFYFNTTNLNALAFFYSKCLGSRLMSHVSSTHI